MLVWTQIGQRCKFTVTCRHSHEKDASLFLFSLEQGRCEWMKKKQKTQRLNVWFPWRRRSGWCSTEICTVCAHTENKQTMTRAPTLQNKKTSISCCEHPPWRMLSCFRSIPHSADDSSPSLTFASCLLSVKGGGGTRTHPSFSPFYLHNIKSIYSPLLGLGNLCPPASQSMDVLPCSLPISCSQPLGGDAQLTNSSQRPPFCGHMIWAITK